MIIHRSDSYIQEVQVIGSKLTLRVAMLLLQGKRNRRVAIRILLRAVRVCDRLGDEHHKLFYIVTL